MAGIKEDPSLVMNEIGEEEEHVSSGETKNNKSNMGPPTGNSIHRSGSRPQLDLSKAAIHGSSEERDPTILLPNQSDDISSHLSLDIGGLTFFLCVSVWKWVGHEKGYEIYQILLVSEFFRDSIDLWLWC